MSRSLKMFIIGFLTCTFLMSSIIGLAAAGDPEIKALLASSVKIKLFGKDYSPKDSKGNYIKPIIYNNVPYYPAATLCQSVNTAFEWDSKTKTMWIGGKTSTASVDDTSVYKDGTHTIITNDADKLTTSETTYKWGIANDKDLWANYFECYLLPNNKFKEFSASLFMDDQVKKELVMEFRENDRNGKVIKIVTINPGETTNVQFNIGGINKIFVHAEVNMPQDKLRKLIIGEPKFINQPSK